MKIRIEIDENLNEEEVVIRSRRFDGNIQKIQQAVTDMLDMGRRDVFYKEDTEYYLPS